MYTDTFKSRYAQDRGFSGRRISYADEFATATLQRDHVRSAYADDLLVDRSYLSGRVVTEVSPVRGPRSTSLLAHGPATVGPVHHDISANQAGFHNEKEVKTIVHEPVTRIETVPVTKQIQVPITHMESKEVAETVQVPITLMEPRTEMRTEMVPVTLMKDKEVKWTERVPVMTMEEKKVTTIEMVPVTRMEPKEVTKIEMVPVTSFKTEERSRIEQVPVRSMEPREYVHDYQVPVTHMQDKTVYRTETFPVTQMETQEQIEYQQIEKTDYVAVEKIQYHYSGVSDQKRGAEIRTSAGEERYLGVHHTETLPARLSEVRQVGPVEHISAARHLADVDYRSSLVDIDAKYRQVISARGARSYAYGAGAGEYRTHGAYGAYDRTHGAYAPSALYGRSTYRSYVPQYSAYGATFNDKIGRHSTLVKETTVTDIKQGEPAPKITETKVEEA